MNNLFRADEIYLIADAITAMVFKVDVDAQWWVLSFEGRQSLKIDRWSRQVYLVARSGIPEVVFTFSRLRPTHWFMWRTLDRAVAFYNDHMHKIRMQDYRAFFGRHFGDLCNDVIDLVDAAEAEAAALAKVDRTKAGSQLHPEVARLVQRRPEDDYMGQETEPEPEA